MKINGKNTPKFNKWICGGIIFQVERKLSILDRFINSIIEFKEIPDE